MREPSDLGSPFVPAPAGDRAVGSELHSADNAPSFALTVDGFAAMVACNRSARLSIAHFGGRTFASPGWTMVRKLRSSAAGITVAIDLPGQTALATG